MWTADIIVRLKNGVLDPQGSTVQRSLENMGYKELVELRIGKHIRLMFDVSGEEKAAELITQICETVLVNPVIEEYEFELSEV